MPINDRNLKTGTKLTARYHKQSYTCEVVEGEGGKLRYRLEDGREFKSPSGAGMAITGHACDGWAFWSVAKDEASPVAPEGQTRWYCRECSKGFLAPVGTTPEACPQGHRAG